MSEFSDDRETPIYRDVLPIRIDWEGVRLEKDVANNTVTIYFPDDLKFGMLADEAYAEHEGGVGSRVILKEKVAEGESEAIASGEILKIDEEAKSIKISLRD